MNTLGYEADKFLTITLASNVLKAEKGSLIIFINGCLRRFFLETLKYWVGVQRGHSYLMGRKCLFSLGWPPF